MANEFQVRFTAAGEEIHPAEAETIRVAVRHALSHVDAPAEVHLDRAGGRWSVTSAWVTLAGSGVVLNVEVQVASALAAVGLATRPRRELIR